MSRRALAPRRTSVPAPPVRILRAELRDLDRIVPLFEAYRRFYRRTSDRPAARRFLARRFAEKSSVIYLAEANGRAVGFVQLYPSHSSLSLGSWWILNDLYVTPTSRGKGVGVKLLRRAIRFARGTGARGISLETARENPARKLYEGLGWRQDGRFLRYHLLL